MAAPRTASPRAAKKKPGRQPMDRLRAEVERVEGATTGVLEGVELTIKPETEWRSSAFHALRVGDFQDWARTTLAGDGYKTWLQIDPTLAQIDAFFETWQEATGQDVGESEAS